MSASPTGPSRPRLLWAAVAVVVAGALMAAGGAWACVPQPNIFLQPRSSGPPGSQLSVAGANFENPVELRWNATDGALLASGLATSFTAAPITLPETPDGLYVVVALERGPGGVVGNVARPVAWPGPPWPDGRPRHHPALLAERFRSPQATRCARARAG